MNHLRPPFDDRNVRWAVQLALDREDWLEFTTVGDVNMGDPYYILHSDAGWGTPVEEFQKLPGFNPATKDADIAEANRILDEVFGAGNRPKTDQYMIQLLSRREVTLWGVGLLQEEPQLGVQHQVRGHVRQHPDRLPVHHTGRGQSDLRPELHLSCHRRAVEDTQRVAYQGELP